MQSIFLWLRKLCGVLLVGIGLLAGTVGVCWAVLFTLLWFKGENLSHRDRNVWLICVCAGIGGVLAFWAGVALKRAGGASPKGDGTFRPRLSGPQRRRSVNAGLRDTLTWMFVAAEVCFIFLPGDAVTRFRHALEGALAVYLGIHAIISLHELGHLFLAAVLGLDLQKLQVGTGPLFFRAKLGGLLVEWRAWLGGGLVLTSDGRERGWRWRHWCYVAGGPVATATGGVLLAWWIDQRHGGGSWFSAPNGLTDLVVIYLCAYSALFWLFCMLPTWGRVGMTRARTDGYQLLHTPRFTPEKIRAVITVTWLRRVETLWEENRREVAWKRLREYARRFPGQVAVYTAYEGHYFGMQGDYHAAAESYLRCLQTEGLPEPARRQLTAQRFGVLARANETEAARQCYTDALREVAPAHRTGLLDSLATEVLKNKMSAFLPEADAWSQEALALEPGAITLKGTRGSVLVELGRLEEGETLLREVWATSASEVDAAISAFYLGVVAKRRGYGRQVRRWFKRSRSFAPFVGKWLTERIAVELIPTARS